MGNMKYKVGNKVRIKSIDWYNENKNEYGGIDCGAYTFTYGMSKFCGKIVTIVGCYANDCYMIKEDDNDYTFTGKMIEGLAEEEMTLDKAGQITDFEYEGLAYTLPDGYIFKDENGNKIFTSKIILEKKKKEYPKTYEECCEILGIGSYFEPEIRNVTTEECHKFEKLIRLKRCRDAYWKIAGEKMGLGKPWEPNHHGDKKYTIEYYDGVIIRASSLLDNRILAFPAEEIRDAFKENFDPYIAICKEFL